MKKTFKIYVCAILTLSLCFLVSACNSKEEINPWETATYTQDCEFGAGTKTVLVEVVAGDKSVTFTINTDKENLEEALTQHNLVAGEKGPYGLFVTVVNGMTADYEKDKSYWAITKNGEYMQTGLSGAEILGGENYEITYTK